MRARAIVFCDVDTVTVEAVEIPETYAALAKPATELITVAFDWQKE